jgi:methylglutaconyl-CoA hydratase
MIRELTDSIQTQGRLSENRVVILTGAGGTFCSGMDLDYLQKFSQLNHEENLEDARNLVKLLTTISSCKKPVIAMVNGPAMGGGCGLASACDIVFAAKSVKLGTPEVRLGFVPAVILFFLIKRVGESKARELSICGKILTAEEAKAIGLVNEVIIDEQLSTNTTNYAEKLALETSPSSVGLTKDLFTRLNEMSVSEFLEYAANLNALTRKTEDFKKGINSFINKEKLQW